MAKEYILMADIIDSRHKDSLLLRDNLKHITTDINHRLRTYLKSPLTITLGDEFQGVVNSLEHGIELILALEEGIIQLGITFKLRYVLLWGEIDTPINPKIAYEMLGPGLTNAREVLNRMKSKGDIRFNVQLDSNLQTALNQGLFVLGRIIDNWKKRDFYLISLFLRNNSYKAVAEELHKDRSLIWKRRKSLRLEEYFAQKEVVYFLAENAFKI